MIPTREEIAQAMYVTSPCIEFDGAGKTKEELCEDLKHGRGRPLPWAECPQSQRNEMLRFADAALDLLQRYAEKNNA